MTIIASGLIDWVMTSPRAHAPLLCSVRSDNQPARCSARRILPGPTALTDLLGVENKGFVAPGDVDGTQAICPPGWHVVSGGFVPIAADGEVFVNDTLGSQTTWHVSLDNFDSSEWGTVTAPTAPRRASP